MPSRNRSPHHQEHKEFQSLRSLIIAKHDEDIPTEGGVPLTWNGEISFTLKPTTVKGNIDALILPVSFETDAKGQYVSSSPFVEPQVGRLLFKILRPHPYWDIPLDEDHEGVLVDTFNRLSQQALEHWEGFFDLYGEPPYDIERKLTSIFRKDLIQQCRASRSLSKQQTRYFSVSKQGGKKHDAIPSSILSWPKPFQLYDPRPGHDELPGRAPGRDLRAKDQPDVRRIY